MKTIFKKFFVLEVTIQPYVRVPLSAGCYSLSDTLSLEKNAAAHKVAYFAALCTVYSLNRNNSHPAATYQKAELLRFERKHPFLYIVM